MPDGGWRRPKGQVKQDMIVWISGPTGSGKSSLTRMLASLGCATVQEELPPELFRRFASNPAQHCEALQEAIMRSRFSRWQSLRHNRRVIFDRGIDEDAHVFCRMHRDLGLLDDDQLVRLQTLASDLQVTMPEPDLIIFMSPQRDVLKQRVTSATHPPLIVDNLDRQLTLYSEWLAARQGDVLRLDNSSCSLQTVRQLLDEGSC